MAHAAFVAPVALPAHRGCSRPIATRRRAVPCAVLSRRILHNKTSDGNRLAAETASAVGEMHLRPALKSSPASNACAVKDSAADGALPAWLQALARVAAAIRRVRTAPATRFARAGAGLALAMVGLAVTRGALSVPAGIPLVAKATGAASTASVTTAGPLEAVMKVFVNTVPEPLRVLLKPFTESFGVVFLSEFGDKSMFATALMAMKHSPSMVLIGALLALTLMTLIACFLGQLMHLLPTTVTHYSTIALFVFFGFQMIWQSRTLPSTPGGSGGEAADAAELVAETSTTADSSIGVLAKICSLIFVAEWCDRSMLATMALAATSNTAAVIGGATAANVICTGMAVGAAAALSSRISERLVALTAGILFEFFAVFTYLEGPEGE